MKNSLLILLMTLLICSCNGRPTPLEKATLRLKSGMNKAEVKIVFGDFRVIGETNQVINFASATKIYSTNRVSTSWVMYGPQRGVIPSLEDCQILFDANDTIIAHYYIPPGHHSPKSVTE